MAFHFKSRDYQQEIVDKTWLAICENLESKPCIVAPTGAGKSWIIAMLAKKVVDKGGRVLVLAHRTELVEQNSKKNLGLYTTIYAAGINKRDLLGDVVIASRDSLTQSFEKKLSNQIFNVIIIDEAHRVNNNNKGGYRALFEFLLKQNSKTRFIGLTATPFRLTGKINQSIIKTTKKGDERFFTRLISVVDTKELIQKKFLSNLVAYADKKSIETDSLAVDKFGDFDKEQATNKYSSLIRMHVKSLLTQISERKQIIIFCCTVEHCLLLETELVKNGMSPAVITAKTLPILRKGLIEDFKNGKIRILIGCNIFTEGFDAPGIDCVVLFRPTKSAALYLQIVGRGLRIADNKKDCLVLDYGGNVARHGRIDEIKIFQDSIKKVGAGGEPKICHECDFINLSTARECEKCKTLLVIETERSAIQDDIKKDFSLLNLISDDSQNNDSREIEIKSIRFKKHQKKASPGDKDTDFTLRVEFFESELGFFNTTSPIKIDWHCLNHEGFALKKAMISLKEELGITPPASVDKTLQYIKNGNIEITFPIKVLIKEEISNGIYTKVKFVKIIESEKITAITHSRKIVVEIEEKENLEKIIFEEDELEEFPDWF